MTTPEAYRVYVGEMAGEPPKAWAVRYNEDGTIDVRLGSPDALTQVMRYPDDYRKRKMVLSREHRIAAISGYACIGLHLIDSRGRLTPLRGTPDRMPCSIPDEERPAQPDSGDDALLADGSDGRIPSLFF